MIDIGKKFGRLIVRDKVANGYRCDCSCGREAIFAEEDLKFVKSCGCIVILGLDLATNSGFAVRYSWRAPAAIKCGVFNVAENNNGEEVSWETKYALAGNAVWRLIKEHCPDFVAIEEPEHRVTNFAKKVKNKFTGQEETVSTINPNALQLTGIVGAVVAICMVLGVPCGTIGARSWHAVYYKGLPKPKDGEDWKDVAIRQCEAEGIVLPPTKKDKRDAAEAVGVSGCWHKCKIPHIKWMQDRWLALRTDAYASKAKREGIAA